MNIKQLHEERDRLYRIYRRKFGGPEVKPAYEALKAAGDLYTAEARRLYDALDFDRAIAYAYNPREHAMSNGGNHIQIQVDQFKHGRITRQKGDTLCKRREKFWGLETFSSFEKEGPSCLACLEIAERLTVAISVNPA